MVSDEYGKESISRHTLSIMQIVIAKSQTTLLPSQVCRMSGFWIALNNKLCTHH